MKSIWLGLSGVFGVVALIFVLRHDFDKAFVIAAVGAVCWFLSYRVQMKQLISSVDQREEEQEDEERNVANEEE